MAWLAAGLTAFAAVAGSPPPPDSDEAAVYRAAGLQARDGGYFRADCDTPLKPQTERLDVDGDGRDEILLFVAPTRCLAGGGGGNVALFRQDRDGRWTDLFGFVPGVEVLRLGGSHQGYADLGIADPGGCMALYHWDGHGYARAGNRAIEPGGCQFR